MSKFGQPFQVLQSGVGDVGASEPQGIKTFPITMPKQVPSSGMPDDVLSFIHIHLQAGADGNLVNILVNREESFGTDFARLRDYVIGRIKEGAVVEGAGSFAEEGEVEFEADYNLKYKNIILAVTAVTGYKDEEGHVIKLMQKIKFVPQKKPPAEKKADE